jgi:hypothetical protein
VVELAAEQAEEEEWNNGPEPTDLEQVQVQIRDIDRQRGLGLVSV